MAFYVDGFVVPVPKDNLDAYRKMARTAGKVWLEYGALEYHECVADDVQPGKTTSFPQAVKLKPNEVVVFSWITYKSRAARDKINAKVMKDPRIAGAAEGMVHARAPQPRCHPCKRIGGNATGQARAQSRPGAVLAYDRYTH